MATKKNTRAAVEKPIEIKPENVRNSTATPIYSNNFQINANPLDVWLCFNEINPTTSSVPRDFPVERRASIVVTVPQFMSIVQMMNQQAKMLHDHMLQQATKQAAANALKAS